MLVERYDWPLPEPRGDFEWVCHPNRNFGKDGDWSSTRDLDSLPISAIAAIEALTSDVEDTAPRPSIVVLLLVYFAQPARMTFRFGILALFLFLCETSRSFVGAAGSDAPPFTATVLVWVRDSRGAPVSGLNAEDFVVSENGVQNRILAVKNFAPDPGAVPSTTNPSSFERRPGVSAPAPPPDKAAGDRMPTQVLLIITPMGPRGRRDSLRDAIRLLRKPLATDWRLGLIDDEGSFIPFCHSAEQMRDILEKLAARVSAAQYGPLFGDEWTPKAARAIRELGVLPGRHVIVCITDYDSKSYESFQQNPTLLRVSPDTFIGEAVSAQAAMYTSQGNGPAVAMPFGAAADSWASGSYETSGQGVANAMVRDMVNLGALRSDLLQAADETGGQPVDDLQDAFKRIAADAAGYYLVTFEAHPNSDEASLHPFSISTRLSHFKVKGPHFYLAPHDLLAATVPADMKAALEVPANRTGLNVLAHAWLFPKQGSVHWATFAADVRFPQGAPAPGSHVKIHAELVNDSIAGIADAWSEEREWPAPGSRHPPLHWQREGYLYPGSYTLRVTAMDTASGRIGEASDTFLARSLEMRAFRFGPIVLADSCLSEAEQQTMRRNLFDPMRWEDCKLAPPAAGTFGSNQSLLLLLRVYPPNLELGKALVKRWKAYAVVDDAQDKAVKLQISAAEVRGLTVTGKLPLESLHLKPGPHNLTVLLMAPARTGSTQVLAPHTRFIIEP